jgi:hypothetical protein
MQEPVEEAEASIPTENVREGPHQNPYRTVTARRKAAKRSERWYNETPPQHITVPLSPLPHAVELRARRKRRLEDPPLPLLTSTDEAASNTASAEFSEGLSPPPTAMPPSTDTVNASTRCQSPGQTQPPQIKTSEAQLDGDDDDVNVDDDYNDDDDDDDGGGANADADADATTWEVRFSELADYSKIHGHCNVPKKYSENTQLANWVGPQRGQYKSQQRDATIPRETVTSGPNLNRTDTVRRKAAKRTDLEPPQQSIAVPLSLSPSPQAEEISARKKPRVEPLPTATDEAAREIALPDISEALPFPDTPPHTVNVSTRRRSRRQIQIQLELIETSEAQPDATDDNDADYVDDGDLSGPATPPLTTVNALTRRRSRRQIQLSSMETSDSEPDDADDAYIPPDSTVNALTRRQSSRRVIPTSSTSNPLPPPSTATVGTSICRRSQRQLQLPPIEMREAQLDNSDEFDAAYVDDDDGDLSGPAPPPIATVNALSRRRSSCRVIPASSTGTPVSPTTATMEA